MGPAESGSSGKGICVQVAVGVAPREVRVVSLALPDGSTLRDALRLSGFLEGGASAVPTLNEEALAEGRWAVGVWGRRERPGHVLRDRDRIEVVRGLQVDPKEARRVRYSSQGRPRAAARGKPQRHAKG